MSEHTRAGRHRHAARYSPVAELSSIARTAGETGVRVSAVLAASGGLVATFALPAQASASPTTGTTHAVGPQAPTSLRALSARPAVVAPKAAAPAATPEVGLAGVKAVARPKPKPAAVRDRTPQAVSRSTQRVPVADVKQSSSEIVNIARTLLGIAYSYGGTSPSTGFDCSGFTQYVFGKAGISLPRTAADQQAAATPVSDPKPGDLVFFGSPAWHVGIYTGNGMMIDSPKPGQSTSERAVFSGVSGYGRF
ncbi:C40 family peptidase [Phycicoccus sonneratiae]|uniref:C40 family peptidase n=1 Tax=Phycicoccus sonneratiae TaxID=2807628 RepID=A0ABS2CQV6_9MICO|nr:NlpC/P60 family protein [Phycicoccus sonneraticus]MBM6402258.1 C40 family peptidase [Phycicoccus sonneraticus]